MRSHEEMCGGMSGGQSLSEKMQGLGKEQQGVNRSTREMLERLAIVREMDARMRFFPNGNAAMKWLAASAGARDLGITQVTEILPIEGVTYIGPLPDEFQAKATYSVGLAVRAPAEQPCAHPERRRVRGQDERARAAGRRVVEADGSHVCGVRRSAGLVHGHQCPRPARSSTTPTR